MLRREQSRLPGKRKETMLNRNMRNTAILLVVFLAVYMFGNYFAEKSLMSGGRSSSYSYERFESDIAKNKVRSVEVVQNAQVPTGSAIVKLSDGEKKVVHVTDVNKVIELAQQYKVTCHVDDVKSSDAGWLSMILPWIVIGVILMFMFAMMSRASGGGGGGNKMMNFGKSRARMMLPDDKKVTFQNVAGLQEEKEDLAEEKNGYYKEFLKKMSPADVRPEIRGMLKELHKRGYQLAIGSSSKNTKFILAQTQLTDDFDAISDGTNITKSKPDPEVFLKAAEYTQTTPGNCLVVEDAIAGIDAAKAGGMLAAGVGEAKTYEKTDYPMDKVEDLLTLPL